MTIDDLKHLFRFQTTATEDYTPSGTLDYVLIENSNRLPRKVNGVELETLVPLLDNFIFEGYRDRTPIFIKPEV
jgi:hypothetical protein